MQVRGLYVKKNLILVNNLPAIETKIQHNCRLQIYGIGVSITSKSPVNRELESNVSFSFPYEPLTSIFLFSSFWVQKMSDSTKQNFHI